MEAKEKKRKGKGKKHSQESSFPDACALLGSPLMVSVLELNRQAGTGLCHFSNI